MPINTTSRTAKMRAAQKTRDSAIDSAAGSGASLVGGISAGTGNWPLAAAGFGVSGALHGLALYRSSQAAKAKEAAKNLKPKEDAKKAASNKNLVKKLAEKRAASKEKAKAEELQKGQNLAKKMTGASAAPAKDKAPSAKAFVERRMNAADKARSTATVKNPFQGKKASAAPAKEKYQPFERRTKTGKVAIVHPKGPRRSSMA
jgi:hypothetical protein